MRRILVIGIGVGNVDHVTAEAIRGLNAFDVLFLVTKDAADDLVDLRRTIVARHRSAGEYRTVELADPPRPWRSAPDYPAAVGRWREQRATAWETAIAGHLAPGETGAFLAWGDPSLFESTLAIVKQIAERSAQESVAERPGREIAERPSREIGGFDYEVIPGVSSIHVLTARHRIPLNRVGGAVQIMPARLLGDGMPAGVDDVVVMLDPDCAFARLEPDGLEIYWGAYLGTDDEILISGPLAAVVEEILAARQAAKARKGWIFDIYLLRRAR